MAFDAGAIEATLTLDRSAFTRELKEAQLAGERFDGKKFEAKADLDTSAFDKSMAAVKRATAGAAGRTSAVVGLTGYRETLNQLDRLQAPLKRFGSTTANAKVGLTGVAGVKQSLAQLQRMLMRYGQTEKYAKVGLTGNKGARASLIELDQSLDRFGRKRATAHVEVNGSRAAEHGIRGVRSSFDSLRGQRANLAANVQINGGERLRGFLRTLRTDLAAVGQGGKEASPGVDRLNSSVSRANQGFSFLRNTMRALKWPALIAGVGLATQAVGALTAGTLGLAGSLTRSLTVAAVGAGGAVMALGQGMSVWKLATGGIGEALGGLNDKLADTKAQKAAFKGLSDEAKGFARELEKMKPKILGLSHVAQQGLIPGLREGLREAAKNFPVLERVVDRTAKALGDMAASAGKALGSAEWGRDLEKIGTRNVAIMRNLGGAAGGVANALRHVAVVGGPVMERLSRDTRAFGKNLADAAARGRASGGMAAFFDRAYNSLKRTVRISRDFGAALVNIGSIGAREMAPLGDSFERTAAAARRFTSSAAGSRKIGEWFRGSLPAVRELGRLVVGLGASITRLGASSHLAPLIQQIRTQMLPAVETLLRVFTQHTGPAFVKLATQLARLFAVLAPAIAPIIGLLANVLGGVASLLAKVPGLKNVAGAFIGIGLAVSGIKFLGMITGLTRVIKLAKAARAATAGVAVAEAGAGAAGGGAAAGGAAAGGKWAAGFKGALLRAGLVGAAVAAFAALAPPALRAGKQAVAAFKQGGFTGLSAWLVASNRRIFASFGLIAPGAKKAGDAMASAHQRAAAAARRNVIEEINLQRRVGGFPAISARARTAVARFAQAFGRIPKARRILLTTNSPQVVAKLAHFSNYLKGIGKSKTVARILGNSKNGVQAARRMEREAKRVARGRYEARLRATDKQARSTGRSIAGWLDRNFGKKFTAKLGADDRGARTVIGRAVNSIRDKFVQPAFKAVLGGDPRNAESVVKGAATLIGSKFVGPNWKAVLDADKRRKFDPIHGRALKDLKDLHNQKPKPKLDADPKLARGVLGSLIREMNNSSATVTVNARRGRGWGRGRAEGGPVLGGFAAGGIPTPTDAFAGAPTRESMGGRHSRPTYLVGEENRTEFVIATNPAYRKANLEYLSMAASALKAPMVPAFAGGGTWSGNPGDGREALYPGGGHGGKPMNMTRLAPGQGFMDASGNQWRGRPGDGREALYAPSSSEFLSSGSSSSKFLSFSVTAGFAKGGWWSFGKDGQNRVYPGRGGHAPMYLRSAGGGSWRDSDNNLWRGRRGDGREALYPVYSGGDGPRGKRSGRSGGDSGGGGGGRISDAEAAHRTGADRDTNYGGGRKRYMNPSPSLLRAMAGGSGVERVLNRLERAVERAAEGSGERRRLETAQRFFGSIANLKEQLLRSNLPAYRQGIIENLSAQRLQQIARGPASRALAGLTRQETTYQRSTGIADLGQQLAEARMNRDQLGVARIQGEIASQRRQHQAEDLTANIERQQGNVENWAQGAARGGSRAVEGRVMQARRQLGHWLSRLRAGRMTQRQFTERSRKYLLGMGVDLDMSTEDVRGLVGGSGGFARSRGGGGRPRGGTGGARRGQKRATAEAPAIAITNFHARSDEDLRKLARMVAAEDERRNRARGRRTRGSPGGTPVAA